MKLLSLKTTATGSAVIKTDYIYDVVDVQKLLSESKHTIRGIISSGAGGVGKSVITDLLGRLLAEALPSDEKTLILDFDTSHGSGIHDLVVCQTHSIGEVVLRKGE
jgi:Mrp family chromosome partitioning ATPase